ncbi:hypothetical protein B0T16DRAFT_455044 [Cercophora newfieldiana]|uniref:Uncharacterized protein n=1 Tax=Cercophora newfieldiana TaxID=92897 RepID=A0AA40CV87_9PEZI|nr:hypothetical protein B0T16DRAFT_455044 [Cercophora newfieldiana]
MMTASPTTLKGPRLTLVVSGANMARLDAAGIQTPLSSIQTPSSTTVEYGDNFDFDMSAAEKANHIFKAWLSSGRIEEAISESGDSLGDVTPVIRKPRPANPKLVNDRMGRFLSNLGQATGDPNKELVQENRGLHQRVAVLQRTEQHLKKDNHELNSHVLSLQQSQEAQKRRFEDELRMKQAPLEARIRELEQQLAAQNERIFKLTLQPKPTSPRQAPAVVKSAEAPTSIVSAISDADVASWFETRGASWASWVDEFAHDNASRMVELHPLQQQEVLSGVEKFIRLTEDRKLPEPLTSGGSLNVTRLLLQGMLSDFIVTEALASPFWIFAALSKQSFDVESPTTSRYTSSSQSPTGFRMDYAMLSNVGLAPCPSPYIVPPAPTTARSISMLSPRHAPPHITPLASLNINTKGLSLPYGLPEKPEMDDMLSLLMKTQQNSEAVYGWRAQLMRMLSDGGLSHDASHPSVVDNEEKQMLANARREYARTLKERFLGSAARFLLRDQDAQGIAKLEGQLVSELDLALRFSAQVWSRVAPMHFIGLEEMALQTRAFQLDYGLMEECLSQTPSENTDREVIMVLQPAVGTLKKIGGAGRVWRKAQVIGASTSTPEPETEPETPNTAVETITVQLALPAEAYSPSERSRSPTKSPVTMLKPIVMPSKEWVRMAVEDASTTPRAA